MPRLDYANARIGAMRARLLGSRGMRELLVRPGLAERLELVRSSDHRGGAPAGIEATPDPLAELDRGLTAELRRVESRLAAFVEGVRPRALIAAFVAFDDGEMLKRIVRGLARAEPAERVRPLVWATPGFSESALRELLAQRDVTAVAALLAQWGSPYAAPLRQGLPGLGKPGGLLHLEAALDRALFAGAFEAARGRTEDAAVLRRTLEARADLTNAATLLKLDGVSVQPELFVPGGASLTPDRFVRCGELAPEALRDALARWLGALLGPPEQARAALASPFRAERLLTRALVRMLRREARARPLSVAVPLAYLLERRAEVSRMRLALRGAEMGFSADALVDLVEA